MTYSKKQQFALHQQDIANIAKALSHPARIAIIEYLSRQSDCCSGDISGEIPLSRTTVSQHLQVLKNIGLIQGTIEGVKVCYCIDDKVYQKYITLLKGFLEATSQTIHCCK